MGNFRDWIKRLDEADTRYSVEVNFRTNTEEVMSNAAKITLGYVSAALKKTGVHVKQVFEQEPFRIIVSSRNWDDGEWVSVVSWSSAHKAYFIARGFYNKDRKTVSVQHSERIEGDNAAEIVAKVRNVMHSLKGTPDRHVEKMKRVPFKRGPK